jgi:LCP family protein required for cell wall assembly
MAKMQTSQNSTRQLLRLALALAFVVALVLTALLTFNAVRDFVTSWEMTSLPGVTIKDATATPEGATAVITDTTTPLQPVAGPTPPPWDGAARVTVLVMGLDYRDWEAQEGPPRTDTMILLTLDPIARTAGMLSIPRDLWVNIPGGYNYGRINTAYQLGEAYQVPGGGPQLAMDTVEELIGVPIDYYAQIDFSAFIKFIDEIGGLKLDIPKKIKIDPLGEDNGVRLKPGVQVISGEWALAYARARYTEGGDFDRAKRQQQVILAIRDRILNLNQMPTLVAKSGVLYSELSAGVHTNLSLDQAIKLAWLASQIPEDKIYKEIISPPEDVNFAQSPDGTQEVLKPIADKIRLKRDRVFTNTGPASPVMADMALPEAMKAEGARVKVLNGSYSPGLAAQTAEYLQAQGVNVVATENAPALTTYTEITFYSGKPYSVKFLMELFKVDGLRLHAFFDPASPVDIAITVGDMWANDNPMPK